MTVGALALTAAATNIAITGASSATTTTDPSGPLLLGGSTANTPPGAAPPSTTADLTDLGYPLPRDGICALPDTFARTTTTTAPQAWHVVTVTFARNAIAAVPATAH